MRVARGPTARRAARLHDPRAAAAVDRDGRVRRLRQPVVRAACNVAVQSARHVLPAAAQRGPSPVHRLPALPVHGRRGGRQKPPLRQFAARQTVAGVRQHALRHRARQTEVRRPRERRRHTLEPARTLAGRKYPLIAVIEINRSLLSQELRASVTLGRGKTKLFFKFRV